MAATLVQEDGTGKTNSNTYVLVAELDTYVDERGLTLTAATADAKTDLLIKAMDYIESLDFIGMKGTDAQALQWPRYGVFLDGYYVDTDAIPTLLQQAQMENAIGIDGGVNPLGDVPRETISEKVGEIEVEYSTSAFNKTYLQAAETKVEKLVKTTGAVYRA